MLFRSRLLLDQDVIWLRAETSVLVERVGRRGRRGHRPLIDADPAVRLAELARDRAGFYLQVARDVIDVDGKTIDEVCDEIVAGRS